MSPTRPQARLSVVMTVAAGLILAAVVPGHAQDRAPLVRLLREGRDFRIRVQAAFALGNSGDPSVRPHLEAALRDPDAAVRAAAASALGRLHQRESIPALRRAQRDSSAAVRMQAERAIRAITEPQASRQEGGSSGSGGHGSGGGGGGFYPTIRVVPDADQVRWSRVRYVLHVGDFTNRSGYEPELLADALRREVSRNARQLDRVAVFDANNAPSEHDMREIRRRNLPKLRIDGNVVKVERRAVRADLSVRCEISLLLLEEPGRTMRGVLNGAATGTEPRRGPRQRQERRLAQEALEGAVHSAMSSVPQALARATHH